MKVLFTVDAALKGHVDFLQEMSRKKLKSASYACQAHYEGLKI